MAERWYDRSPSPAVAEADRTRLWRMLRGVTPAQYVTILKTRRGQLVYSLRVAAVNLHYATNGTQKYHRIAKRIVRLERRLKRVTAALVVARTRL